AGQINARPARSKSPDFAFLPSIAEDSWRRLANISVKPSGMCCTTSRQPGKSLGSCEKRYCKAFGPPVETPMATTREGQWEFDERRGSFCFVAGSVMIIFGAPEAAATLILIAS